MKPRSRRIGITLEENVARWLRAEAAKNNISVSDFLSGIVKERINEAAIYQAANYEAAKNRAFARKPFLKLEGRYLTREEAHDRSI